MGGTDVAALAGQHGHLLEEERVPFRGVDDAPSRFWVEPVAEGVEQALAVLRRERLEQDGGRAELSPAHPGRTSRSSGRAMQSSKSGEPRERSATWSSRSSSIGSAQCRSSNTATSGRSAATASSCRRTPRTGPRRGPTLGDALERRRRDVAELHQHLDQGQNVIPSP